MPSVGSNDPAKLTVRGRGTGRQFDTMLSGHTSSEWSNGVPLTLSPGSAPTSSPGAIADKMPAIPAHAERTNGVLTFEQPTIVKPERLRFDIVEEWGMQSFPASDPPANW